MSYLLVRVIRQCVGIADVAQLVELQISNLNVASSNLVVRSDLDNSKLTLLDPSKLPF